MAMKRRLVIAVTLIITIAFLKPLIGQIIIQGVQQFGSSNFVGAVTGTDGATADIVAFQRGTNAQALRIYNTFTDASNFERALVGWSGNVFNILVSAAGSGASRSITIGTDSSSSGSFSIQTSGTTRWQVNGSSGNLLATTDNSTDVGAVGATRPRTVYVGTSIVVPIVATNTSSVLTITTNVIAPVGSVHHVGAGLIKTITVPSACTPTCTINIVPDAAFTYDGTGNVVLPAGGGTAVINRLMTFTWDAAKWTPSY